MKLLRWRVVTNSLGLLIILMSVLLSIPLLLSFIYSEDPKAFLIPAIISITSGTLLFISGETSEDISIREAFTIVSLGWFAVSLIGALPFFFHHFPFIDAFFESVSGFTGTGATIIEDIESQPRSLLFWRSFTQWVGGMGIIVLFIAIFPKLSVGGRHLFAAEAPGIDVEKIKPRIRDTAKTFWEIYLVLSAVLTLLLVLEGMSLYDALVHTFSTLGTGGFSSRNDSIGFYSPAIQYTIAIFMFIASTNFVLHYKASRGELRSYLRDEEFRFYLMIVLLSIFIITLSLLSEEMHLRDAFRLAAFQTISIMSATGFSTADFDSWSWLSKALLFSLMFMGGCANSTAGGIKAVRVLLVLKYCFREIRKNLHPSAVIPVRLNGEAVEDRVIESVVSFFILYILIFLLSSLILAALGYDFVTGFSASITCLSNVGPGLGFVGPSETFAPLHPLAKLVLSFDMIAGRLEVLPVLILLYPKFWKE